MTETTDNFHEYSKNIVRNFIQNVVILDDLIFQEEINPTDAEINKISLSAMNKLTLTPLDANSTEKEQNSKIEQVANHNIDTQSLMDAFIKEGILCSCISPNIDRLGFKNSEEKLKKANELFPVLSKADIVILDWQTFDDDKEGELTCELLKKIKNDPDGLKLVVIYTGTNINNNVKPKLIDIFQIPEQQFDHYVNNEEGSIIANKSVQIKLILKDSPISQGNTSIRKIKEKDLPNVCIDEFAKKKQGLIINSILSAITDIRKNTSKILSSISQELDIPFINHKMQLPCPSDADDFLLEFISDRIISAININKLQDNLSDKSIKDWYKHNDFKEVVDISDELKNINLIDVIIKGFPNIVTDDRQNCDFIKHFLEGKNINACKLNKQFTSMTQNKTTFYSETCLPYLTLGTVLSCQEKKITNERQETVENKYYLCLQPRCDSVRVDEKTNFILMPLCETGKDSALKLCVDDKLHNKQLMFKHGKVHDIKLVAFKKDYIDNEKVTFKYNDNHYVIESQNNDKYILISELKFQYAQRIIQQYANDICRVGFDEYEWFRKLHK